MVIKYNTKRDSYNFSKNSANFFINIGLQVTRRCNLKCIYCCEPKQIADSNFNTIKKIVDKLAENGLKKICVTGGEPLLRKDLLDILKYIKSKQIYITLSTNGSLLDKNKLEKIEPHINNIRFSIRGLEKNHNEITKSPYNFNETIKNIQSAVELKIPVSVVATIILKNHKEMLDMAVLCEKNKVEKLYFFSLISRGRGTKIFKEESVNFKKSLKEYEKILEISKKEKWNMETNIIDWSIEGQCVLVFPNGEIAGVPSFSDKDNTKIIGNVLTDDIAELWREYQFKENYINYYVNH